MILLYLTLFNIYSSDLGITSNISTPSVGRSKEIDTGEKDAYLLIFKHTTPEYWPTVFWPLQHRRTSRIQTGGGREGR